MNPMKRAGLKLFSLCVLALGLVAFSATAAQAEGVWMVNGKTLVKPETKELKGKIDSPGGSLLGTLGLNAIAFTCTAGELIKAKLEGGLKVTASATEDGTISAEKKDALVRFSGCTTSINGALAKACEPISGASKGVILTEEGYALLKEHLLTPEGLDGATTVLPKTGNVFAIIHMGEACSIGEEVKVFGTLSLHDVGVKLNKDELETERVNHLVAEFGPLTALKIGNAKSESKATLDGEADIELTSKETWSGLPMAAEP